ncbi:Putative amidoligase enzyme [Palleronia marisminoris]|uniref:amidoligase family protein n=1 Tax=Palleronia marisminoris TaxID=315423 RepID=UPI0008E4E6CE|nr:amidoligase family protein [Palleronia marisminoris]SFH27490.1 Putative amidoligase enzyme [Palleronia marisminoris]
MPFRRQRVPPKPSPKRAEVLVSGDPLLTREPTVARIDFADPPERLNATGDVRSVGVEIEFGSLTARQAAAALAEGLGADFFEEDAHALIVNGTAIGDLMVEIDTRYAHPQRYPGTPHGRLSKSGADMLGRVSGYFVPRELVTPPVSLGRLALVDEAVEVLRRAGARERGPAAFGLHFNPEPPRLDAEAITAILKAFLLLNGWLRQESRPRRPSHRFGFGRDFPGAYIRRVVSADYWPELDQLMDDYLAANPTRKRDLDLLPLFLFFDERRVRARLPNEKIGKRAVLHYRLPTARVSQPNWSIAPDWNRWVAVERLAADRPRLERLAAAYLAQTRNARDWANLSARLAFGD